MSADLEALAKTHNGLGLAQLVPVRVRIAEAALPADLAGHPGWARLPGRLVWTEGATSLPGSEAIAAEWVEGDASCRLRFGPAGRSVIAIREVEQGGEPMLREVVRVLARGFDEPPPRPALLYHVYWGLDESGAIDRRFDAFMGFVQ